MNKIKKMWNELKGDLISIEMLKYTAFGFGTALIDIGVYSLCYRYLPIKYALLTTVSNVVAWVMATIFAFFTNKYFVFNSKGGGKKHFLYELLTFFGARALTLVMSLVLLLVLVDLLHLNPYWSKIGVNVLVVIANYVVSKLLIFKKPR